MHRFENSKVESFFKSVLKTLHYYPRFLQGSNCSGDAQRFLRLTSKTTKATFILTAFDPLSFVTSHRVHFEMAQAVQQQQSLKDFVGDKLLTNKGGELGETTFADGVEGKALVGFYFSAHWCPVKCPLSDPHNLMISECIPIPSSHAEDSRPF